MKTTAGPIVFLTFLGVCAVSHVSAFAQTNRVRDGDDLHSSHTVVRTYTAAREADDDIAHAANVAIPPVYRALVDAMLTRSPTFRRQYARIACAVHLSVVVRSKMPSGRRSAALTQMSPKAGGAVEAEIFIPSSSRAVELIAHEFEHIIERLDGVDLRGKARLRATGVRLTADEDSFETTRAVLAGQRVVREVLERTH